MANVEKKGYVDPGWPDVAPGEHPVTDLISEYDGANSPWGNDFIFPVPYEETGYVHPYTRVNRP
ncbi:MULTISPECIES: hypothetical protein [Corynebacterium]|uniref:hypothetical protein n=1 Tax=Corynebacterium TaxID=1716 RepID=UPI00124EF818|nr:MULTISPECIES: hypothetical protein [Corynebacterium]